MNCAEVREGLSALSRGGLGLTELALLGAHVRQCVDCQQKRESVQHVTPFPGAARPGTTTFAAWLTRETRRIGATSGRAWSLLGLSASANRQRGWSWHKVAAAWRITVTSGARCLLRVCTAGAGLVILVMALVFLWLRQWPEHLVPRPSTGEQLSEGSRPPLDGKPAEPVLAIQLAESQTPKGVSPPQPASAPVSQPEAQRVAMRPTSPDPQPDVPASLRSPDPALTENLAIELAPIPSAEASLANRRRGGMSRVHEEDDSRV